MLSQGLEGYGTAAVAGVVAERERNDQLRSMLEQPSQERRAAVVVLPVSGGLSDLLLVNGPAFGLPLVVAQGIPAPQFPRIEGHLGKLFDLGLSGEDILPGSRMLRACPGGLPVAFEIRPRPGGAEHEDLAWIKRFWHYPQTFSFLQVVPTGIMEVNPGWKALN